KHKAYLRALWARLSKKQRQDVLSDLGSALDEQLPKGEWWPLLKMLCALRKEGWDGLSTLVRLRLENLIVKDVLAGYINIHQVVVISSSGSLGTYARQLWPYFSKPEVLAENIISLLHQNWFTQNYVGKYFLP